MRPAASASGRVGLFALLALSSLALKAAVGPPRDGKVDARQGEFERIASSRLHAQRFTTTVRTFPYRTTLLLAQRGTCRLAIRDARDGAAFAPVFAQDARAIGTVRYLYRGSRYERPPELALRLGRIEAEAFHRLGIGRRAPVLVALAASPSCDHGDFGMGEIRDES